VVISGGDSICDTLHNEESEEIKVISEEREEHMKAMPNEKR